MTPRPTVPFVRDDRNEPPPPLTAAETATQIEALRGRISVRIEKAG